MGTVDHDDFSCCRNLVYSKIRRFSVFWIFTVVEGNGREYLGRNRPQGGKEKEEGENPGITAVSGGLYRSGSNHRDRQYCGVATALTAGGPGALFWMWVSAFMGMMTAYAETSLGQKYRYRKQDGHWMCGPMVYMERGVGSRCMGVFYAGLALLSSLGMGSMVQSNSMSMTLNFSAGIRPGTSAVMITTLTALVILGGIERISRVTEKLMPVSAGIYIVFSGMVLFFCRESIWPVLKTIFSEAFTVEAAGGGAGGFLMSRSIRYGSPGECFPMKQVWEAWLCFTGRQRIPHRRSRGCGRCLRCFLIPL